MSPQSISLTWEDQEAFRHDLVLRHPWAGELEVCEHFGKGRRGAGHCVSPAFLSILPAAAWAVVQAEGGEPQPVSQGMDKMLHSLKAKSSSKSPAGQRQNHNSTMLCWILRRPICPRVLECLAAGQSEQHGE